MAQHLGLLLHVSIFSMDTNFDLNMWLILSKLLYEKTITLFILLLIAIANAI